MQKIPPKVAKAGIKLQNFLPLERPKPIASWMIDAASDNIELDITRARTLLDWKPRHSLRDTLLKMVSGLKADSFTWYRENELELPLWLKELMPAPEEPDKKMEPHELMRLAEQVRKEIEAAAPPPMPSPEPEKPKKHHEMMGMKNGEAA